MRRSSRQYRVLYALLLGGLAAASFGAKPGGEGMSLDAMDARIRNCQQQTDSLTALMGQLHEDSVKIVTQAAQSGPTPVQISDSIARQKGALADLNAQYAKARQDSAAIIAKFAEQAGGVRQEAELVKTQIAALRREIESLSAHGADSSLPLRAGNDRAIAQLQAEIGKCDSAIRARQADMTELAGRVEKLRQDSARAETARAADRSQFYAQIHELDSLIALCDAELSRIPAKQAAAKADMARQLAQLQENAQSMTRQKQECNLKIPALNREINALNLQRTDLREIDRGNAEAEGIEQGAGPEVARRSRNRAAGPAAGTEAARSPAFEARP